MTRRNPTFPITDRSDVFAGNVTARIDRLRNRSAVTAVISNAEATTG
jgi:hypothetical protein